MREHALLFGFLAVVVLATLALILVPEAVTWILSQDPLGGR